MLFAAGTGAVQLKRAEDYEQAMAEATITLSEKVHWRRTGANGTRHWAEALRIAGCNADEASCTQTRWRRHPNA